MDLPIWKSLNEVSPILGDIELHIYSDKAKKRDKVEYLFDKTDHIEDLRERGFENYRVKLGMADLYLFQIIKLKF